MTSFISFVVILQSIRFIDLSNWVLIDMMDIWDQEEIEEHTNLWIYTSGLSIRSSLVCSNLSYLWIILPIILSRNALWNIWWHLFERVMSRLSETKLLFT